MENNMRRFVSAILFIVCIIVMQSALGQDFEDRKNAFLWLNGEGYEDHVAIWAWLENNDQSKADQIHEVLQRWVTEEWRWGWDLTCVQLTRVFYQYGDRISEEDHHVINQQLGYFCGNLWMFHTGSINNRFFDYTVRYVNSERRGGVEVQYGEHGEERLPIFTWEGRTYVPGQVYNSLVISRDWFYWRYRELLTHGDEELDAEYTKAIILSLYVLYDFCQDPDLKRATKMMLDFLLLDSIMDVGGAGLHGGNIGRTYANSVYWGHPQVYQWIYWGVGPDPGSSRQGQFFDAYVSTYRLPSVIEDLGITDDEPDNYWHLNKENNFSGYHRKNEGKWTYVTKYYNLGGSSSHWMLNVKATGRFEEGIRLWVNDKEGDDGIKCSNGECYMDLGKYGYQYENAMYIRTTEPYLHWGKTGDFEYHEVDGNWHFYREGNVVVALCLEGGASYLEVAIMGVDYSDYYSFRNAILQNAHRLPWESGYMTSRGDKITEVWDPERYLNVTYVNDEELWDFPFKRIEVESYSGTKPVQIDDLVMTLEWHGRRAVYDFNDWTYSFEHFEDETPPAAPQGVSVTNKN